ncbi:MAG: phosphomannomutase/phosphoglucomutase [Desulfobacteraceae bacterium]|nr:phosphomannomutase/phosphoglucomutase [Desulfobacteraceae bacterium]MCF8094852.1 phosphomannomutase/phosphoglucomutase [Desulfobacteraceae bacterium]
MNPAIFREYDIRGIADKDITDKEVYTLAKAIGTYMRQEGCTKLALGYDCRLTSERYAETLMQGLAETGCEILNIGMCPTPVLYFSIRHLNTDGGVMVTASHNPPEYNGFKICLGTDSVHGDQLQKIREIAEKGEFAEGPANISDADAVAPYFNYIKNNITIDRPVRVGIDAGNGTAGVVAVSLLKSLGCEVHDIYCEPDGRFPNHEADPTVICNLEDLIALVREKNLDVGIGYDGDGDRIGIVDHNGKVIYGDQLMIIFAREILSRKPGSVFISEVKCSKTMYDDIEKRGGQAIMWKTGHSLIKEKMKQEQAALAGEMSGHMFFADRYFGFDDAIYSSCRLLEILSATGSTIDNLLEGVPDTHSTPEIRVECPDEVKFRVVEKARKILSKKYEVIDIDGVRIVFEDGWGLVRASNTQPALVMRFEALSPARREEIRKMVESTISEIKKNENCIAFQ